MNILNDDLIKNREELKEELEIENYCKYHNSTLNQRLIVARQNWKITDALCTTVSNCVEWIPIHRDEKILEIGGKYGNITEMLSKKDAVNVWTLENDFKKCEIIEKRIAIYGNTNVILGDIEDLVQLELKFSKIFLVGAFSHVNEYISHKNDNIHKSQIYALDLLSKMLEDDGDIIIAEDNKLALKMFNGAKLSRDEQPFMQIENNDTALLSKKEWIELLEQENDMKFRFYYPYPDYKYTDSIYSDDRLPDINQLDWDNYCWEEYGYNYFKDSKVFNSLIQENLFSKFSNSFLIILSKGKEKKLPIYIKYSNERNYKYQIRTEIWQSGSNKRVFKKAYTNSSINHIQRMYDTSTKNRCIGDNDIHLCKLDFFKDYVSYDYVEGKLLSQIANSAINDCKFIELEKIFDRLGEALTNDSLFISNEEFEKVFGEYVSATTKSLHKSNLSNIDLILQNIIVGDQNQWTIIDYEWGFSFDVPAEYILWRSIFYLNRKKDKNVGVEQWKTYLYDRFDIDADLNEIFLNMEKHFQRYISRGSVPVRELRRRRTNIELRKEVEVFTKKSGEDWKKSMEQNISAINGRTFFSKRLKYNECDILRLDPCSNKCLIHVNSITNGYGIDVPFDTNCTRVCGKDNYLYVHTDPQIVIKDMANVVDRIEFDYDILNLPDNFIL